MVMAMVMDGKPDGLYGVSVELVNILFTIKNI